MNIPVIANGDIETPEKATNNIFTKFFDYSAEDYSDRPIYRLKNMNKLNEDEFISAINSLLKVQIAHQ